jgi:hypothetical protein
MACCLKYPLIPTFSLREKELIAIIHPLKGNDEIKN